MLHSAKVLAAVIAAVALVTSSPASGDPATLELDGGGILRVEVPAGWAVRWLPGGGGGTLELVQEKGSDSQLLLTVLPVLPADSPVKDAASLRAFVESSGERVLPTAVQDKLTIVEVAPEGGAGFAYHLTDRNPEKGPGDFREVHQGALLVGGRLMTLTMLRHPGEEELAAVAIGALRSVRVERSTVPPN